MPHCPLQQMNGATPYLRLSRLLVSGKSNALMQHCDFANGCLHATLRLSKRMAPWSLNAAFVTEESSGMSGLCCIANQEINAGVPHCDVANLDSRLAQANCD